jgi:hypothetical protein
LPETARSTDYDITTGAFQTTLGGGVCEDVFVTKLDFLIAGVET